MQNSHENSMGNAGRVTHSTINPGNGNPKNLRLDVIKEIDWNPDWDSGRQYINDYPVLASYAVLGNSMVAIQREAIYPNDDLKAETISIPQIIPGKTYIVTDFEGNVYLGNINHEPTRHQPIVITFLNSTYSDIPLTWSLIESIALVYSQGRNLHLRDSATQNSSGQIPEKMLFFSANVNTIIDTYLSDENTKRPASDPLVDTKGYAAHGVPFIRSKQLYPDEMVLEAKHPDTTKERQWQILQAFTKGHKLMQEMNVPAYRVMFIENFITKQIQIWLG